MAGRGRDERGDMGVQPDESAPTSGGDDSAVDGDSGIDVAPVIIIGGDVRSASDITESRQQGDVSPPPPFRGINDESGSDTEGNNA